MFINGLLYTLKICRSQKIGKGFKSTKVVNDMKKYRTLYLSAVSGVGILIACGIKSRNCSVRRM
ncbi:MAG: fumarate hydratase C-terminal domain-containing protein [Caldanaerobacter subterraneus]|nr:fumarate hydratase C-terminal domain-containing protein [Caldanaerobacter subterraneus]